MLFKIGWIFRRRDVYFHFQIVFEFGKFNLIGLLYD